MRSQLHFKTGALLPVSTSPIPMTWYPPTNARWNTHWRGFVLRMLDEVRDRKYSVYDERTGRGLIRHLMARIARHGERMAVARPMAFPYPEKRDLSEP